MRSVLAFDLASNSGFCFGHPGGTPGYGSFRAGSPNCSIGAFISDFDAQARAHLLLHDPDVVVFEAPILKWQGARGQAGTSIQVARKLMGLCSHLEFLCYFRKVECFEASASDVAQYFLGKHVWPGGRDEKKRRTIEACKALGFDPADDDAADAIALWCFAVARLAPKLAPRRWNGPLLGAAP